MTVRVYREARGRLVLEEGERRLDLTDHLRRHGQPADLVELFESGWFDRDQLEARLAETEEWRDAGDLAALGTPLPSSSVGKILALGKNFRAHAEEFDEEVPAEPLFFNKLPETLTPHDADVEVPAWYDGRVDHEAELALIIGLGGKDIPHEDALEHVAAFTVANDLTARTLQGKDRELGHPWLRAKNLDGFCPLGPCLVPRAFLDIGNLQVTANVNGEERQRASTRDLVVDVPHAIAWLSRHLTLHPGDVILMGTPAGVGPLRDGDTVVCAVEGIGELATTIRRPSA